MRRHGQRDAHVDLSPFYTTLKIIEERDCPIATELFFTLERDAMERFIAVGHHDIDVAMWTHDDCPVVIFDLSELSTEQVDIFTTHAIEATKRNRAMKLHLAADEYCVSKDPNSSSISLTLHKNFGTHLEHVHHLVDPRYFRLGNDMMEVLFALTMERTDVPETLARRGFKPMVMKTYREGDELYFLPHGGLARFVSFDSVDPTRLIVDLAIPAPSENEPFGERIERHTSPDDAFADFESLTVVIARATKWHERKTVHAVCRMHHAHHDVL